MSNTQIKDALNRRLNHHYEMEAYINRKIECLEGGGTNRHSERHTIIESNDIRALKGERAAIKREIEFLETALN